MTLHLTTAEWERIAAAGSGVLFREAHNRLGPDGKFDWLAPHEFVEAAQPCENKYHAYYLHDVGDNGCPDCINGKRRVAVVVPCEMCRGTGMWSEPDESSGGQVCVFCLDGKRRVGHVVVTWGARLVRDAWKDFDPSGATAVTLRDSDVAGDLVLIDKRIAPVDPQTIVGQYAIGVEVVQ